MIDEICKKCKIERVMHQRGDDWNLCCKCHIEEGGTPADWHSVCMKEYDKLYPTPVHKFSQGTVVVFKKDKRLAKIAGSSTIGRLPVYSLTWLDNYGHLAWVDEDELSLPENQKT